MRDSKSMQAEADALIGEIDAWRDAHWDEVVADIENLVEVASTEDLAAAREGAPFGPGPREALDRALVMAARYGLESHDCDGYIGFADLPGSSEEQVGIIGHVDVVPAGPGWTVEPYAVTRRDGWLLGRGVIDDKGPLVVALHAVRFWAERCEARGERLPRTIRVLFGANEETNMKDVEHYRALYDDPAFLFTPDSQFPLGYGESGICSGTLESAPIEGGQIRELAGGQAVNAVAGEAHALVAPTGIQAANAVAGEPHEPGGQVVNAVAGEPHALVTKGGVRVASPIGGQAVSSVAGEPHASTATTGDQVGNAFASEVREFMDRPADEGDPTDTEGVRLFEAKGTSAHAIDFEQGESAIGLLVNDLLEAGVGAEREREFLELLRALHGDPFGKAAGIACEDADFGPLSIVGGVISLEKGSGCGAHGEAAPSGRGDGRGQAAPTGHGDSEGVDVARIRQTLDFRYPTTTTAADIERGVNELAARLAPGATFRMEHDKPPFLMDPDSPDVRALLDAYCAVTGEEARGMTSKGGTYARCFERGVSFGPEKPWLAAEAPDWAGGMHGPDEAVSEEQLREAFAIYALAIGNLMQR